MRPRAVATRGLALAVAVSLLAAPARAEQVDALLEEAVGVTSELTYAGTLVVASFSTQGPQVTRLEVTSGPDGSLRLVRAGGWEIGRTGEEAFLRRSDTLLRIGGTERIPFDRERLRRKYEVRVAGERHLDTGRATALEVRERGNDLLREMLYVDVATGLIVRRETFDRSQAPVRVVAFTDVELVDDPNDPAVGTPDADGLEVEDHRVAAADVAPLRERGFLVPETLPDGYELLGHYEAEDARVPTLHLVYGDGLYTISLFEQQGRLAHRALGRAEALETDDGGVVWRWPGSEPRRVVWSGGGLTFTALTDAPTDELLAAIGAFPKDAPPSIVERLMRGLSRLGRWLSPGG